MNTLEFIDKFGSHLILIYVLYSLICNYFIFQKIGYSGISGIIPVYNSVLLFRRYYGRAGTP